MVDKHTISDEVNLDRVPVQFSTQYPQPAADESLTVRIPALIYLRAMVNLFWSAIRHPLSETTIDLNTGRVLRLN